jgi:protein tyrosine/serine phosphatase
LTLFRVIHHTTKPRHDTAPFASSCPSKERHLRSATPQPFTVANMNPHQQNKVDVSVRHNTPCTFLESSAANMVVQKMSEQEAKLFRLYGKLPNKKDLLQNKLKVCQACEVLDSY